MTDFFTSDLHFGHDNIIKYCKRPFKDAKEMTGGLIDRWNQRVKAEDNVYVVGDFAFMTQDDAQRILNSLNGQKFLVRGNHDKVAVQLKGWGWVKDLVRIKVEGTDIVLCHYPMRTWDKSHHGSLMFHGHTHGTLPAFCNQSLDVGVDCWDYTPVTLDQIKARLKTLPPMPDETKKYRN